MNERTFRIGPIRPPSEAQSLLLQVTNGCTWNKCRFCQLYRHTKFKAYSADSIKADIDNMVYHADRVRKYCRPDGTWDISGLNRELMIGTDEERQCFYMVTNWLVNGGENVFLQDGNTTALSSGRLTDVLIYLRQAFPQIKRITSYGRAENLSRVSAEEFAELKEAGLDRIHSGYESGSDAVLQKINKGVTAQQEITAGRNIKAGGIELSVYFMPGVGGRDLSRDNAEGMAHVINEVNPDFIRIRTSVIKPGTELYEDFLSGDFVLCSDDEKLMEIRTVIEKTHDIDTKLVSDHIVNLLQGVKGSLRNDRDRMLDYIDRHLAQPEEDRKIYQALRRMGRIVSPGEVSRISSSELDKIRDMIAETEDPYEWEVRMNELMCRYI
ncbi:MAG: radical SAM protein [Lentihominibacter sp.]